MYTQYKKASDIFFRIILCTFYSELSASAFLLKSIDIHHTAETATIIYIALLTREAAPPNIHATRSNWKIPISPQLIPPMIRRISAILSHIDSTSFHTDFSSVVISYAEDIFLWLLISGDFLFRFSIFLHFSSFQLSIFGNYYNFEGDKLFFSQIILTLEATWSIIIIVLNNT